MVNRVAIDCDGVLANFDNSFVALAKTIWPGREFDTAPTSWHRTDMTSEEVTMVWDKIIATPNFWLSLEAYSDNVGALARFLLRERDVDVFICTSRTPTAGMTVSKQTSMWLGACGVSPVHNYLAVAPCDESNQKVAVYKALGVEWSIDDKDSTVLQCDNIKPAYEHKAYLLDRPWNQGAPVKRRVFSLAAYLSDVSSALAAARTTRKQT